MAFCWCKFCINQLYSQRVFHSFLLFPSPTSGYACGGTLDTFSMIPTCFIMTLLTNKPISTSSTRVHNPNPVLLSTSVHWPILGIGLSFCIFCVLLSVYFLFLLIIRLNLTIDSSHQRFQCNFRDFLYMKSRNVSEIELLRRVKSLS